MKTNTFEHLQGLCAGKRIVCERNGRKIDLTTPDGSVSAECESVAEALDVVGHDPAFCKLPIVLHAGPAKSSQPAEQYEYKLSNQNAVINTTRAQTLNEALMNFGGGFEVEGWFHGVAMVKKGKDFFGVKWQPI